MGKITADDVTYIAKLAKIDLKKDEVKKISDALTSTVEYVGKLNELDTSDVPPTSQVVGLKNVYREDEVKPSLTADEALSGTDKTHNGYFVTGRLINKDL